MLSKNFISLLTVASVACGLPVDALESPVLDTRATGGVVAGALHAGPATAGKTMAAGGGGGPSAYKMYSGDGSKWPTQAQWIGDFETM